MNVEIRAGKAHIYGYVNKTSRESEPVITPRGRVIERIMPGAFELAIRRADNITFTVDHGRKVYASTADGSLLLNEDEIGLYADAEVTDAELIDTLSERKPRGWSFGMYNIKDRVTRRSNELPLRTILGLDLDHITLVMDKIPSYKWTSVLWEIAAEQGNQIAPGADLKEYRLRLNELMMEGYRQRLHRLMK